jgi:type VI secretion system secreted protein Hcp
MAVDQFIKIAGIKGESEDHKHKGEIDVLSWSWGMSNSGSAQMGGGSGSGKASFQDISFTKWIDRSTPTLMGFAASGEHIPKAELVVRKAGGKNPLEYIKITMQDLIISSVSTGGSGGEDRLTENVTLNFAVVDFVYTPQTKEGGEDTAVPFHFNIKSNTAEA